MRLFTIPDKARLKSIFLWGGLASIAFPAIYGACNYYASQSITHYPMYFDFELSIPLLPWMINFYMSLNLLFVLAAFIIDSAEGVKGYCLSLIGTLGIASVVFLLFPGELGFERVDVVGDHAALFKSMHSIDKPFNLFPSLHVTYSTLSAAIMINHSRNKVFNFFMILWICMISASVLFVHQHHLFDVFSGFLLAWFGYKYIYKYFCKVNAHVKD
jgi:membrane-associated phospholipid phosphatase